MATRPQQVAICASIADKCDRVAHLARIYQQGTIALDPDKPGDSTVSLSPAQQAQLVSAFDNIVAGIKTDAASL